MFINYVCIYGKLTTTIAKKLNVFVSMLELIMYICNHTHKYQTNLYLTTVTHYWGMNVCNTFIFPEKVCSLNRGTSVL